jgi:L-threonylcarbamoyladenylate synthase
VDGESRIMKTVLASSPAAAAKFLRAGGVVAFPTETVYGLGANALDAGAVKKIFRAKGRPSDNPLIVHIASLDQLSEVAARVPRAAQTLIDHFFPGPLTVIVPRGKAIPKEVSAGLDTVGVRLPEHPVAQKFLRACGVPVAAPSANRSGRPSPTTWSAVREEMEGRVDCILKGGSARVGLESTVVDCTVARPVVLRLGAVTLEQLREVMPGIRVASEVRGAAKSPGMKYRHYAPSARVVLVDSPADIPLRERAGAYIGLSVRGCPEKLLLVRYCRGVASYAKSVFAFFRACEQAGVKTIYGQRVPAAGLGRALMDRLEKAAERKAR